MEQNVDRRVKPISPMGVEQARVREIPDVVLTAFNQLIAKNAIDGSARVLQKDVVAILEAAGLKRSAIYDNHWLDVEPLYEEAGWEVRYDKASYGDNYFDAYFQFDQK